MYLNPLQPSTRLNITLFYFLQELFHLLGVRDFMPNDEIIKILGKHVCRHSLLKPMCEDVLFLICGFDHKQLNAVSTTENPQAMFTVYTCVICVHICLLIIFITMSPFTSCFMTLWTAYVSNLTSAQKP